ncbi:hypothetical protein ACC674_39370, partial [Rhizobium ruizarguesonis]
AVSSSIRRGPLAAANSIITVSSGNNQPFERRAFFRTHKGRSNTLTRRILLSENPIRFSKSRMR